MLGNVIGIFSLNVNVISHWLRTQIINLCDLLTLYDFQFTRTTRTMIDSIWSNGVILS